MRALSWKQPFAAAMFYGKIETRVWDTQYRGQVLICASASSYTKQQLLNISGDMSHKFFDASERFMKLSALKGVAIGVAELFDTYEMTPEDEEMSFVKYRKPWPIIKKTKAGHFPSYGKLYCHQYVNAKLIEPIPWKGKLGWQMLSPEFIAQIKYL